jgi:hypothetical protein
MSLADQATQQYNKYNPEQKNYFHLGLTLGLLILLIALIYPALQHILNVRKEINEGRVVLGQLEKKADALVVAKDNFEKAKEHLPTLESALPTGSAVKDYIKRPLEGLARQNSLRITGLQFVEVPLSKPSSDISLKSRAMEYTFSLSGDFANFNTFVTDLERFIRTTEVNSITLVSVNNGDITANLRATTHYLSSTPSQAGTAGGNQ